MYCPPKDLPQWEVAKTTKSCWVWVRPILTQLYGNKFSNDLNVSPPGCQHFQILSFLTGSPTTNLGISRSRYGVSARIPFGGSRVLQNGSARTRADADATHMKKAPGVMQMRQTRQMQVDEDACIRN